jgi:hypothetical protein
MDIIGKITLYSAGFGALAGVISGGLSKVGVTGWAGLLIALICIYVLVYKLIPLRLGAAGPTPSAPAPTKVPTEPQAQQLPSKQKIFTTGFLPFFIMWLVIWITVYTLTI